MAREDLSFLYFLKVVMLLTKQYDIEEIYANSQYFKSKHGILDLFDQFFKKHHKVTNDALQTEIVLYQIDYYKLLMSFPKLFTHLNETKVV